MKALWIVVGIMLVISIGIAVGIGLAPPPLPFVEPVAYCVVPGMMQRSREEDIPIGFWMPCKSIPRQQNI